MAVVGLVVMSNSAMTLSITTLSLKAISETTLVTMLFNIATLNNRH